MWVFAYKEVGQIHKLSAGVGGVIYEGLVVKEIDMESGEEDVAIGSPTYVLDQSGLVILSRYGGVLFL